MEGSSSPAAECGTGTGDTLVSDIKIVCLVPALKVGSYNVVVMVQ